MLLPRWVALALLALSVVLGTWLRHWPSQPSGRTEFLADGATVARLALESARTGRMPAVDSLAEAPAGRALGPVLAPGLIVGAGIFHRLLSALGSREPGMDLVLFGALAGGLIAIPVYLWARLQWGAGVAAPFAALLVIFLPAHLHRTFGYFMRYEAAGSLLVASHMACLAAALASPAPRRRLGLAVAAAFLMVAALWMWRVPLIVPMIEAALLAVFLVGRGAERPLREVFTAQMVVLTLGMLFLEYLRVQRVAVSGGWLASCSIVALSWVPRLAPGRTRMPERAAWLAAGVILAILIGRATGGADAYGSAGSFLAVKLRSMLGLPVAPDPMTRLMLVIEELRSISPLSLLIGVINFAWLGPWLLFAPLVLWLAAGKPPLAEIGKWPAHSWLLAGMTVALLGLSLFVHRAKVLAAAPAVVVVAGVLQALLAGSGWNRRPAGVAADAGRNRARAGGHRNRGDAATSRRGAGAAPGDRPLVRRVLALLLVASFFGNVWLSVLIAASRESRIPDGERAALGFLRTRTPPNAIIASLWEHGFEVQSYARRRTLLDGFLESDVGRDRILELAKRGFDRSPEPLAAWCRSLGANYLLVPPSTHLTGLATLAAPEMVPALQASAHLGADEANRAIIRMMVFGSEEPPFRKVFEHEQWRVYALADSAPPR